MSFLKVDIAQCRAPGWAGNLTVFNKRVSQNGWGESGNKSLFIISSTVMTISGVCALLKLMNISDNIANVSIPNNIYIKF